VPVCDVCVSGLLYCDGHDAFHAAGSAQIGPRRAATAAAA
jgi:hypothetical protein